MATDPINGTLGATCSQSIGNTEIGDELEHVIASATFRTAPRLAAFLRFVVEMAIAGRSDRIKSYTIGADALGRGETFDPQADPIVRVEAGRLRRALARYYGGAGSNDPVVIELPRGSYVPTFHARANAASTTSDANPATLRGNPGSAELAAVLAGLMDLRQQQVNAMAAEVESERRMLELVRELLAAVGVDACRTAPPLPNAISTGEPARGPRQSEIPPHSPCRHCPDRQP